MVTGIRSTTLRSTTLKPGSLTLTCRTRSQQRQYELGLRAPPYVYRQRRGPGFDSPQSVLSSVPSSISSTTPTLWPVSLPKSDEETQSSDEETQSSDTGPKSDTKSVSRTYTIPPRDVHKKVVNDLMKKWTKKVLGRSSTSSRALILDTSAFNTSRALNGAGIRSENIFIVENNLDEYTKMVQQRLSYQVFHQNFVDYVKQTPHTFHVIYGDFMRTAQTHELDVSMIFSRQLLEHGGLLALTFCNRGKKGARVLEDTKAMVNKYALLHGYHITYIRPYHYRMTWMLFRVWKQQELLNRLTVKERQTLGRLEHDLIVQGSLSTANRQLLVLLRNKMQVE